MIICSYNMSDRSECQERLQGTDDGLPKANQVSAAPLQQGSLSCLCVGGYQPESGALMVCSSFSLYAATSSRILARALAIDSANFCSPYTSFST